MASEEKVCAKWEDYMEMGHPDVDSQHKRLIEEINKLCVELKEKEPDADKIKEHIKFVLSYAKDHFATEEKIMEDIEYPGYLTHYNMHRWFEKQARALVDDYIRLGPTRSVLAKIHHLLVDWLVSHICGTDGELRTYYKAYVKNTMSDMYSSKNTPE